MDSELAVEVHYNKPGHSLIMECLGPNTVVGMVSDSLENDSIRCLVIRGTEEALTDFWSRKDQND